MKERLSRLDRIYRDHPIYYISCCTHARSKILATAPLHEAFRGFVSQAEARQIFVGRYVIMPDHLHLFVALPAEADLSGWMKSLKNTLSKVLRASGVKAPHWQKGYFDHLLRSDASHDAKWLYVQQNPVEEGLASMPGQWPYQGERHALRYD
jgi:putative transposase